jgi:hypothetical protein
MKFLSFMAQRIVCASKDTIVVYDLSIFENGVPKRESITSTRSLITSVWICFNEPPRRSTHLVLLHSCMEVSHSYAFVFLGLQDGNVEVYDVERGAITIASRLPNQWVIQEEVWRKASMTTAPYRRHMYVESDKFVTTAESNETYCSDPFASMLKLIRSTSIYY